jgi:peptidyl-prolyl cis-trans isomerase C
MGGAWLGAALICSLGGAGLARVAAAQDGDKGRIVLTVGSKQQSVGQVERELRKVPLFKLRLLGKSEAEVRMAFVNMLANLDLLVQGAKDAKLDAQEDIAGTIRSEYARALSRQLVTEAQKSGVVDNAEVEAFYEKNQKRYRSQKRVRLWQIVLSNRAEAKKLLEFMNSDEAFKKDPAKGWRDLARKQSLDRATRMRGGDLGFVQPDGRTAHRDVTVPVELWNAAQKVKDGQIVPVPIPVGRLWVVVWRRGSIVTPTRTLAMEARSIRELLVRKRVKQRLEEMRQELRKRYVSQHNPDGVDMLDISSSGEVSRRQRPGGLRRRHPAHGKSRPAGMPGHLR